MNYPNWMHAALAGELTTAEVAERLANNPELQTAWNQLQAVEQLFTDPPMAAPRYGFAKRFNARLAAEQRAQERLHRRSLWGAFLLGVGAFSVSGAMVVVGVPVAGLLVWWLMQNGNTGVAATMMNNAQNTFAQWLAIANGLWTSARAIAQVAAPYLNGPTLCVALIGALTLIALWVALIRKFTPRATTV